GERRAGTGRRGAHPKGQRAGRQRDLHSRRVERRGAGPQRHRRDGGGVDPRLADHRRAARYPAQRLLAVLGARRLHVSPAGWSRSAVSDPVRVAVVGAGSVAQVAHLPVLRKIAGVEIAAICDNDLSKAQALAARFDVRETYDDIEEVLRYAHPDVVVVCTPNHLHEIHAVAALSAGGNGLCEPPLGRSVAGVERVLKAAERYGKRVMVAMNHRFRSDVQAVRGFLAGGELGTIDMLRGGWFTFQPAVARQQLGWRLRRAEAGGGAMLDLGLPLIDL